MITEDGEVNFAKITLVSNNADGKFYTKMNLKSSRVIEITEDVFKMIFIDNAKAYDLAKSTSTQDIVTKRLKAYKYYENQIDLKDEDMFTALLYGSNLWVYIK